MAAAAQTDEECLEVVEAFRAANDNKAAAARSLNMPVATFKSRLDVAARRGMLGFKPVLPGMRIKRSTLQTDENGDLVKQWVTQDNEPGPQFELPEGHSIKGVSALTTGSGDIIQQWVKTKQDNVVPDIIAACKKAFADVTPRKLIRPPKGVDQDLLTVYPIADQHMGLHAWGEQTGEDYDLRIGSRRLRDCMSRCVAKSDASKQAIILNLGDWQHTDDAKNMTPRSGNILDVDSRYFKILTAGVDLMKDCIDMTLQKHARVIVRNLPGNHDPHASVALTVALHAFYSKNPRVTVDMDPSDFFWHRFGKTLIGATHGHKMKADRMALTMAVRKRKDWGLTDYHWFLFGHIHHETLKEVGDVRVESFQTLAAKDNHAHSSGYNSGQSLQSITIHRKEGEIGRHRINIPPPHK